MNDGMDNRMDNGMDNEMDSEERLVEKDDEYKEMATHFAIAMHGGINWFTAGRPDPAGSLGVRFSKAQ